MIIPIDFAYVFSSVVASAIIGLSVLSMRLWADVQRMKAEVSDMRALAASQGSELRRVTDVLTEIRTDLTWIKQKLSEVRP